MTVVFSGRYHMASFVWFTVLAWEDVWWDSRGSGPFGILLWAFWVGGVFQKRKRKTWGLGIQRFYGMDKYVEPAAFNCKNRIHIQHFLGGKLKARSVTCVFLTKTSDTAFSNDLEFARGARLRSSCNCTSTFSTSEGRLQPYVPTYGNGNARNVGRSKCRARAFVASMFRSLMRVHEHCATTATSLI